VNFGRKLNWLFHSSCTG